MIVTLYKAELKPLNPNQSPFLTKDLKKDIISNVYDCEHGYYKEKNLKELKEMVECLERAMI